MMQMKIKQVMLWVGLGFCSTVGATSFIPGSDYQTTMLFSKEEAVKVTIHAEMGELADDRDRFSDYRKAWLYYQDCDSDTVAIPFEIKTRGNYRLREQACDFPPLKLKFDKTEVQNTLFESNTKIKLVTHCRDASRDMQQSVMREYLAYKIYNLLTPYSYRVRLAEVAYVDAETGENTKKMGFFIEPDESLSARKRMEEVLAVNYRMDQLAEREMLIMSMFQYMIGNNDWSVPKLHNVYLMTMGTHVPPVALPYDFDMSSFVNPPYRKQILGEEQPLVKYQGSRVEDEQLELAIEHFKSNKEAILDMIVNTSLLDIESKQVCIQQVKSFYQLLESKRSVRQHFVVKS